MQGKVIDISTILGVLAAFALVAAAIYLGGNVAGFIDVKSVLIVVFGTLAVTTACFSLHEIAKAPSVIVNTVFYKSDDVSEISIEAVKLAQIAKNKGLLELDKHHNITNKNTFLKDGIQMVVDNAELEHIEKVLDYEVSAMASRHSNSVSILRKAAEVSPAMGLIGTLIGLVQMLGNLEDASTIGPSMAVALLTTFYGAVLSYMVFAPLASKLERNTKNELLVAKIYSIAVKSIVKKESPMKLEAVINSVLPPTKRIDFYKLNE